jgi:UDP-N-acetylglucosamine transferase subunit ALG13
VIVVTVGSNGAPFDRLLRELEGIDGTEEMLVQHGPSNIRPTNARCVAFLHFSELEAAVRSARLVITHAGVGSVLLSLMNGKRPIVVPREARFDEVVDDHQVHFAERLARDELVTLVRDPRDLPQTLAESNHELPMAVPSGERALHAELADYLRSTVRTTPTR